MEKVTTSKRLLLVVLLAVILVLSIFVSLKVDFDNRDGVFLNVVRESPDGMQAFQKLAEITPSDAIIFSWWDYGRAIQDFGGRRPVVAYASKDILQSVAATQNPIYALEMQIFGTYEPSAKIHDVARAFLLPEDESLAIMREYGATYVMVFPGQDEHGGFNDLQKFAWIASIAGYNASDYVQVNPASSTTTYQLTPKAERVTMLRLLFDGIYHPQHFTRLYENNVAKIYRIDYSTSQSTENVDPVIVIPMTQPMLAHLSPDSVTHVRLPRD